MGIVRTEEDTSRAELEELCRMLVCCGGVQGRKKDDPLHVSVEEDLCAEEQGSLVCVTCGVSYLGLPIVKGLLVSGFSVRIIIDNPEDIENLREMERGGETGTPNKRVEVIMAKLTDFESLLGAFEGCDSLIHTSAFTDSSGLSGYTKTMAEIEVKATENVMEACARTSSIRKCVLTSSLAACVWRDSTQDGLSTVINQDSWSNESFCTQKKLWFALGKMRAETAAWRIAKERGLKLTTVCPGLITGPDFYIRNPTATVAYLKGAKEMYEDGVLACVDVMRLAEAHVRVLKEMSRNAFGRYICFDKVIGTPGEAEIIAKETRIALHLICGDLPTNSSHRFKISKQKLQRLM